MQHGIYVNAVDSDNRSALHWATTSGSVSLAEYLLRKGASVNLAQKDGHTALHTSTILGDRGMAEQVSIIMLTLWCWLILLRIAQTTLKSNTRS